MWHLTLWVAAGWALQELRQTACYARSTIEGGGGGGGGGGARADKSWHHLVLSSPYVWLSRPPPPLLISVTSLSVHSLHVTCPLFVSLSLIVLSHPFVLSSLLQWTTWSRSPAAAWWRPTTSGGSGPTRSPAATTPSTWTSPTGTTAWSRSWTPSSRRRVGWAGVFRFTSSNLTSDLRKL